MEITVFSRPNCNPCAKVKTWLNTKNVRFREVDVTQDLEGFQMLKTLGYSSVPVISTGSEHWSGIDLTKMKGLVKGE